MFLINRFRRDYICVCMCVCVCVGHLHVLGENLGAALDDEVDVAQGNVLHLGLRRKQRHCGEATDGWERKIMTRIDG